MVKKNVSVIGTGVMGSALVKAFLANNYPVTVWNRTASKCIPLEQTGAKIAKFVVEVVEVSEVIVVNVANYTIGNSLLYKQEIINKLKGKVIIQLTTGTPGEARESEVWANKNEIVYLDGAILDYPKGIGTKECTLVYAGSKEIFEANESLLLSLGGNTVFVGNNIGNASTIDSAILSFYYGASLGFLHGTAICESEGFSTDEFLSIIMPVLHGPTANTMKICENMISKGNYEGSEASLRVHTAAITHVLQTTLENGIDKAYPECLLGYFKKATAMGHSQDEQLAALFEVMKKKV
jgi:3-hydroxyisobutyrate dehydrogenase-like beta-hydroxyacid dehydrogenase